MSKNLNNNFFSKEIVILLILYISLIISFFFGENSTGGALNDYVRQKAIVKAFSNDFLESFLNYEKFTTRHSPVLIMFLSIFERIDLPDLFIRIIYLHICLLLPLYFFKCLKVKFSEIDNPILLFLTCLIFISPTFRSLTIWPDSRILGLTFFVIGIFNYLRFEEQKKLKFVVNNILFVAVSSYISPNFSIFSLFFFSKFILYYGFRSRYLILITILNLFLSLPAIYYVFVLDVNFFLKSAAIGIEQNEKIIFNNIFNDILITFSLMFFYILPFFITKMINLETFLSVKNVIISLLIFIICVYYFDYNYLYGGGGIIFKASNFLINNNYIFYCFALLSILVCTPLITQNYYNIFLFLIIVLNNPQYTLYHKYFDPFLLITFFTIFSFKFNLKNIFIKNNYYYVIIYFIIFLLISNLRYLWTS